MSNININNEVNELLISESNEKILENNTAKDKLNEDEQFVGKDPLKEERLKNLRTDRKLKIRTLKFIQEIIWINVASTLILIVLNLVIKLFCDKEMYSEQFIGFLLGSQVIVMPFILLQIITKHLFPTNKE